jgi:hypothetical protein
VCDRQVYVEPIGGPKCRSAGAERAKCVNDGVFEGYRQAGGFGALQPGSVVEGEGEDVMVGFGAAGDGDGVARNWRRRGLAS